MEVQQKGDLIVDDWEEVSDGLKVVVTGLSLRELAELDGLR